MKLGMLKQCCCLICSSGIVPDLQAVVTGAGTDDCDNCGSLMNTTDVAEFQGMATLPTGLLISATDATKGCHWQLTSQETCNAPACDECVCNPSCPDCDSTGDCNDNCVASPLNCETCEAICSVEIDNEGWASSCVCVDPPTGDCECDDCEDHKLIACPTLAWTLDIYGYNRSSDGKAVLLVVGTLFDGGDDSRVTGEYVASGATIDCAALNEAITLADFDWTTGLCTFPTSVTLTAA